MIESIQPVLQDFVVTLCTGVLAVLSGFIIALVKKGVDWVSKKIQSVEDEKVRQNVADAVTKLENIVTTTVTSLQQTLGDDIKESIENNDGRYTRDDLLALKDKAFASIKNQLTASTTELLESAYDNLDELINNLIENAVHNLKTSALEKINPQTTAVLLNE